MQGPSYSGEVHNVGITLRSRMSCAYPCDAEAQAEVVAWLVQLIWEWIAGHSLHCVLLPSF